MFNNIPPSGFPQIDLSQDVKRINAELSSMASNCSSILTDITAETVTVSGNPITISDALSADAISVVAEIEPEQDLHGYDRPWSGGSGKNKLNPSIASSTVNDVEITKNSDGSYTLNGTASAAVMLYFETFETGGASYILSGCPSGGSYTTYCMGVVDHGTDYGNGLTFNEDERPYIRIASGYHVDHMTFHPMIRLASVTDANFEPYSNICPISGMTEVNVQRMGKNLIGKVGGWDTTTPNTAVYDPTASAICSDMIPVSVGSKFIGSKISAFNKAWSHIYIILFDKNKTFINSALFLRYSETIGTAYTVPDGVGFVAFSVYLDATDFANISAFKVMVNVGENALAYAPYVQPLLITASLGTTVYGGSVDVTEGSASVTMANIASYDGETIGEPWLSSMDEYVSGATPTTGAQVVYTLATPTTLSFTSDDLSMLSGENTISTDAEEVSVEYIKNTLVGRVRRLEEEQ